MVIFHLREAQGSKMGLLILMQEIKILGLMHL